MNQFLNPISRGQSIAVIQPVGLPICNVSGSHSITATLSDPFDRKVGLSSVTWITAGVFNVIDEHKWRLFESSAAERLKPVIQIIVSEYS